MVVVLVPVLVLQQSSENRRGFIQMEGLAELRELLQGQRAGAAGIKAVKDFSQALLVVALLLAVIHPTGQHPALEEKREKILINLLEESLLYGSG